MHNSWGSYPIFFRTLPYDPYQVLGGRQDVSFWYFVPSWNFIEGLVCLEPFSLLGVCYLFLWHLLIGIFHLVCFNGYLIPCCIVYLVSFKWWFLYLVSYFSLGIFLWFSYLSCVDLACWYNLDNLLWCHTFVCLLGLLGGLSKLYLLVSWKSWACIFTFCTLFGMLSFLTPIYKGNSTKSQIGWDVHGIQFHIYMQYLCGVCPMYWCF